MILGKGGGGGRPPSPRGFWLTHPPTHPRQKKMKFIKGARTWRALSDTQTLFLPSGPPPPGVVSTRQSAEACSVHWGTTCLTKPSPNSHRTSVKRVFHCFRVCKVVRDCPLCSRSRISLWISNISLSIGTIKDWRTPALPDAECTGMVVTAHQHKGGPLNTKTKQKHFPDSRTPGL